MRHGLASFRKRTRDVSGGINPKNFQRPFSDIQKPMRHIFGDKAGVHRSQFGLKTRHLGHGATFQHRDLLIAVVAMYRRLHSGRENCSARGKRRAVDTIPSNHQPGFNAVPAGKRLDRAVVYNGIGTHVGSPFEGREMDLVR